MPIIESLKANVLGAVRGLRLDRTHFRTGFEWSDIHRKLLNFCLENRIIFEDELNEAIVVALKATGRECYKQLRMRDGPWHPDNIRSPEALAYAIRNGELTEDEIASIKFQRNVTAETFMEGQVDTLLKDVLQMLTLVRTPQPA